MEESENKCDDVKTNENKNAHDEELLKIMVEQYERIQIMKKDIIDLENRRIETTEGLRRVEKEQELLLNEINAIEKEEEALQKQCFEKLQNKAEMPLETDFSENVQQLSCLLNYHITEFTTQDHRAKITLHFNSDCFVQLVVDNCYDLIHIEPMPTNFSAIKQFLQQSQDVKGFLLMLRKYFKYSIHKSED